MNIKILKYIYHIKFNNNFYYHMQHLLLYFIYFIYHLFDEKINGDQNVYYT